MDTQMIGLLDVAANNIANLESDTLEWDTVIVYLLESLELRAAFTDQDAPVGFELVLESIQDSISDRLANHSW